MSKTKTETQDQKLAHQNGVKPAAPVLGQRAKVIQDFGTVVNIPAGLEEGVRLESTRNLNQVLADTMMLRDMYKKHHWQLSGVTFYQLHLLFDEHFEKQVELVDALAERIQALGGVSLAMPQDIAEQTRVERPPIGREEVPVQLSRLLEAHELILKESHELAKAADEAGDDGTNDLLVSQIIRTNEAQVWFLSEHLVAQPLIHAK
jgi:starvation-inducible DNA-binding protein